MSVLEQGTRSKEQRLVISPVGGHAGGVSLLAQNNDKVTKKFLTCKRLYDFTLGRFCLNWQKCCLIAEMEQRTMRLSAYPR